MTDEGLETNCSMIEKNLSKGVIFSDLIATFAMSVTMFLVFLIRNTTISENSDMQNSGQIFVAQVLINKY